MYNGMKIVGRTKADNHSYSYDQVSNRKSASEHGTSINYTIATNSNRLTSSKQGTDETKYEYDSAGNIIRVSPPRVGATNYVYDNLNRLAKVEVDGLQNGKTLASYQYNAFSQRIQKDVNGAKTIFIYNSAGQLLEEQNKQQNTIRDYVYVDGQLIAAIENGIISYITTDHLNAPQIITSQTGQTIWSAKYDPFGKATVTGNIKYNLRANGQYQDDETGLYYNWYRYYNPELGRYITSDPLGLQAGMNTYIYVNGNPINYTDPQGLCPWCVVGGIMGAGINAYEQYQKNGKIDYVDVALAGAAGAASGFVGTYAAAKGLGFVGNMLINGLGSGAISAVQQTSSNILHDRCLSDGVYDNTIVGIKSGFIGALAGYPGSFIGRKSGALWNKINPPKDYNSLNMVERLELGGSMVSYDVRSPYQKWSVGGSVFSNLTSNLSSNYYSNRAP